jgi:hypothetical protein
MNRPEQRRSYWDDGSWVGSFSLRLYPRERWFVFALECVIAIFIAFALWPDNGLRLRLLLLGLYVDWSLPAIPFAVLAAATAVVLLTYGKLLGVVHEGD